jgi:hypothetical protein
MFVKIISEDFNKRVDVDNPVVPRVGDFLRIVASDSEASRQVTRVEWSVLKNGTIVGVDVHLAGAPTEPSVIVV